MVTRQVNHCLCGCGRVIGKLAKWFSFGHKLRYIHPYSKKKCKLCGKEIMVAYSRINKNNRYFCCQKHYHTYAVIKGLRRGKKYTRKSY